MFVIFDYVLYDCIYQAIRMNTSDACVEYIESIIKY